MSSHNENAGLSPEPSDKKAFYSALGWLGVFCIFALIVVIAYLPNPSASSYDKAKEERKLIRAETESAQQEVLNSYAVVDAQNGVVRIPVSRAMEIVVQELRKEQEISAPSE